MYCRNCGEKLQEKELTCKKCNTKKNEGVNFCHNCGHRTSERLDYCRNCGAKLNKIIPLSQRKARIQQLTKDASKLKKLSKRQGIVAIICITLIVLSFLVIELRPEPEGIPELGYDIVGNYDGSISTYGPNYRSRFASDDVQDFWSTNIMILGFAIGCFIVFIYAVIMKSVYKKMYKKTINRIKEEKKYVL